jgi:hypothetical protein
VDAALHRPGIGKELVRRPRGALAAQGLIGDLDQSRLVVGACHDARKLALLLALLRCLQLGRTPLQGAGEPDGLLDPLGETRFRIRAKSLDQGAQPPRSLGAIFALGRYRHLVHYSLMRQKSPYIPVRKQTGPLDVGLQSRRLRQAIGVPGVAGRRFTSSRYAPTGQTILTHPLDPRQRVKEQRTK